jgi:hypothetical protein
MLSGGHVKDKQSPPGKQQQHAWDAPVSSGRNSTRKEAEVAKEEFARLQEKASKVKEADAMNEKLNAELQKRDDKIKELEERLEKLNADISLVSLERENQDRKVDALKAAISQAQDRLNGATRPQAPAPTSDVSSPAHSQILPSALTDSGSSRNVVTSLGSERSDISKKKKEAGPRNFLAVIKRRFSVATGSTSNATFTKPQQVTMPNRVASPSPAPVAAKIVMPAFDLDSPTSPTGSNRSITPIASRLGAETPRNRDPGKRRESLVHRGLKAVKSLVVKTPSRQVSPNQSIVES